MLPSGIFLKLHFESSNRSNKCNLFLCIDPEFSKACYAHLFSVFIIENNSLFPLPILISLFATIYCLGFGCDGLGGS